MIRTTALALALILFVQSAPAEDHSTAWIKFFSGQWSRTSEVVTKTKGGKEEKEDTTSNWTGELGAGGKALVSKGKDSEGKTWLSMMGKQKKRLFEYGTDSTGIYWTISLTDIAKERLAGKLKGTLEDGTKGEGKLVMERTKDGYITIWEVELTNGDVMKGKEQNKRKK